MAWTVSGVQGMEYFRGGKGNAGGSEDGKREKGCPSCNLVKY